MASRRLREFVRQAWPIVEPSTPFVPGWHIDAIVEHLEAVTYGQIRNLLMNVPPRHMKSLLVAVFWPAWEWIRWPERRWLYSSYGAQLSIRDSIKCRRLIESPWYQHRWGDRFSLTSDQNTKGRFDNDRSGYRLATSVGGAATGEGGDRIICDDPHNVQEAESDAVRKVTLDWWDVVISTRVNDPKTAAKVVVMQRCHQQDLGGHLLEQGGWEHLCLPAEYEGPGRATSIGWSDPRTEQGELLWPDRFGPAEIESLKISLGSYAAAGQLQQRPSPAGGGMFKRHWFRYWQPRGANLPPVIVRLPDGTQASIIAVDLCHQVDDQIQSWDCSFKDLHTSDYVVGQAWARVGAVYILTDQVRARMDCPTTVKAVRELSLKWPGSVAKLIEDKANGSAVIQMLALEIPGILPVNPEGGKVARAAAVSPLIEAGNVYLPHPQYAPWVNNFIEECAAFPNGAHDRAKATRPAPCAGRTSRSKSRGPGLRTPPAGTSAPSRLAPGDAHPGPAGGTAASPPLWPPVRHVWPSVRSWGHGLACCPDSYPYL
jgi:predicted phage terminase large subunit-like protein